MRYAVLLLESGNRFIKIGKYVKCDEQLVLDDSKDSSRPLGQPCGPTSEF